MLEVNFREWRFYAVGWIEDKRAPKCPVMQRKQACCPSAGYPSLPLKTCNGPPAPSLSSAYLYLRFAQHTTPASL